jgi:broad specificity phosphatase PhoE
MKIILIRHFKVDFKWKFAYNSVDYEKACMDYNNGNVIRANLNVITTGIIISSTMTRCIETTRLIFNKLPDNSSDLLREVPITPFVKTNVILPTFIWNIIGRIQWRFNSKNQPETFAESRSRVDNFIDAIISQNEDCVIVAHGWIIKLIISRLIKDKFQGLNPTLIRTGFPYEYIN